MNWKYNTSNDYIEYLSFHDCLVESIKLEDETVLFGLEYVYISEEHPLNPYNVAKSTGRSRLLFNGVSLNKAINHLDDGSNQQVFITDLGELEILRLDQIRMGDYFSFDILCANRNTGTFCSIKIEAKNFTLEWNEYLNDAWFVGWKNN
ncbi:hypothetical protein LCL96_23250 [Rossellomorea aquimaris]|uniref:hypothetical protein n=1 Tax=Rossellomorea aquimaris TaxID=189382 RepID=UPI001CD26EDB|nr:hypothetical protein [Rossellomorea aquimaris]MCA1061811.1 hypothetical protein [Rossellomorea aquimaris]